MEYMIGKPKLTCKVCDKSETVEWYQVFLWAEDKGHGIYHWPHEKLYYWWKKRRSI
jgi:hypothetical protein